MSQFSAPAASTDTLAGLCGGDGLAGALNALDNKFDNLSLSNIPDITASAAEINVLDGIPATLTATELGYVDGVTSSIQAQLNGKEPTLASASDIVEGKVELATTAETTAGIDVTKAVTPDGLHDMTSVAGAAWVIDDDTMATASVNTVASSESTKAYVDANGGFVNSTPASDHQASGIKTQLTAAADLAFGDAGYIASTGKVALIDADAIASMSAVVMCADATIATDATGNFLLFGVARDDTWNWTVGGLIYGTVTGTTGNTLSQTAPTGVDDVIQIMGVATHADRMLFNPQLMQIERTA